MVKRRSNSEFSYGFRCSPSPSGCRCLYIVRVAYMWNPTVRRYQHQLPIPVPSPVPVSTADWGADLLGSSVSRTLQRRLWCVHLPTPVLAKGVLPFSLPWIDSVERAILGLYSLLFPPLKEQMVKNVSVSHYSDYRACISWSFTTYPGVMSLATPPCSRFILHDVEGGWWKHKK